MFEINARGGGGAGSVLDVFYDGKDERQLAELLVGIVLEEWPFQNETVYNFDVGIQTAPSSRKIEWTRLPRRKPEQSDEERDKQEATLRLNDRIRADEAWEWKPQMNATLKLTRSFESMTEKFWMD